MKTKDVLALEPGNIVMHSRYGECVVKEVMMCFGSLFGVQILPQSAGGKALLRHDAGVNDDMAFLEDSARRLKGSNGQASAAPTAGQRLLDYEGSFYAER